MNALQDKTRYRKIVLQFFILVLLSLSLTSNGYAGENKMKTITLVPDEPYIFDEHLTITVVEILEKRKFQGSGSVMMITMKLKSPTKEETLTINSDHPKVSWYEYDFEYQGGWRKNVELNISSVGIEKPLKTISLLQGKANVLDENIKIKVVSIVEKRLPPDRRSVMKVTLRFQTSTTKKTLVFNSDNPIFCWGGYEFEYQGGWRHTVELKILKEPKS